MTDGLRLLVFHRALGYVHRSIPDAVDAMHDLGDRHGFAVESTDDPDAFAADLPHDVAVFVHTSGDVLPAADQRAGLERFVESGGGFVGVHAASAMGEVREDWPWYRDLVGASFKGHTVTRLYTDAEMDPGAGAVVAGPASSAPPDAEWLGDDLAASPCEAAVVRVEDPGCPAADGIVDGAERVDEWYGFHENPRHHVNVLVTVDESTYEPDRGAMGADHPVAWWHDVGEGRSVYNSMGHAALTWRDETFLRSIAGAVRFAAGRRTVT